MITWIDPGSDQPFPPASQAMHDPNGLLAAGADFSPKRLLSAYRQGIFPWYDDSQPILWWSPEPRMVLHTDQLHISRRLKRDIKGKPYTCTADTAFKSVLQACAAPRPNQDGTWITDDLRTGFVSMHELGHAHSIEVWHEEELVGGVYGMAIGRMFFGESMFSRVTNGSKHALYHLCRFLLTQDFPIIDCQVESPHLTSMGAIEVSRTEFEQTLKTQCEKPGLQGKWTHYFATQ